MAKKNEISWIAQDYINKWIPFGSYYFLIGVVVFLIGSLTFSSLVKVAQNVEAIGHINSEQKPIPIKAPFAFEVSQVHVKENQFIKKGTLIVSSEDSFTNEEINKLNQYKDNLNTVIRNLKSNFECKICITQINKSEQIYAQFNNNLDIIEIISPVQNTSLDLKRQIEENLSVNLQTADIKQNIKTTESKILKIKQQRAEKILAQEYEQLSQELITLRTRLKTKEQENLLNLKRYIGQLETNLNDFQSKFEKKSKNFKIEAPFDGTTSSLKVKGQGELLNAGDTVLELVPQGSKLIAELTINSRDIGQIKPNMDVILSFDAFPEAEYGTVKGKLISVDRFDGRSQTGQPEISFIAKVALQDQKITKGNQVFPFIIGMSVRGKVLIGYQTMLQLALNKIFHTKIEK